MLAAGKLRVLSAGDPEPYPDSIRVEVDDLQIDEGMETSFVSKAGRKRKGKTAIQKAIEKTR